LADLFIVGVAPIDYSSILLLTLFGFRIAPDTLSSIGFRRRSARHYPCLWIQRPSSDRWRDFYPPDSSATQHTLRQSLTSPDRASAATAPRLPAADRPPSADPRSPGSHARSVRARFFNHAGLPQRLRCCSWICCLPLHRQHRHPQSVFHRGL